MQNWLILVVAFLMGVLVEWLLEIFFFRRRIFERIEQLETTLRARDAELNDCQTRSEKLQANVRARDTELGKLRAELNDAHARNKNLLADVENFTATATTASATIKTLEGERESLRAQLAQRRADLDAALRAHATTQADLHARNAEVEKLRAQTDECRAQQDALRAQIETLQNDLSRATAELEQSRAQPAPVATVAQIRARSAEDETPYVVECPQHLSDVKGIGSVYETRLYEAGVGSYWELSQLSTADLKRILQLTDLQAKQMDFRAIRAEARRLARQTRSLGRRWNGRQPDDFEPLKGIGKTYEKRLYDAGICTYQALANATVELLEEICHAPAQLKPDYAAWIRQAKALAAKKAKRQATGGDDVPQ